MLNKRIPTLVALFILVVGGFFGVLYVQDEISFLPRANPAITPKQVKITNISENSFTVSWLTDETTSGFIRLGSEASNLDQTIMDERDQLTGESGQYRAHYVTVRGLTPQSTYYFKLGSGERFLFDNNGSPFSITTAPNLPSPPVSETIYGTVLTRGETPADDTIVYAILPDTTPMSGLVRQNGNYAISISSARTPDLNQYASFDPNSSILSLLVHSGRGDVNEVVVSGSNARPVPNIILGQTQGNIDSMADSSRPQSQEPRQEPRQEQTDSSGFTPPEPSQEFAGENKFTIMELDVSPVIVSETGETYEDLDTTDSISVEQLPSSGMVISDLQPIFSGEAPPNVELIITVNSPQTYTSNLITDESGTWQWQVPGYLEEGEHTLSIAYTDEQGILQQIQRRFIVSAAATGDDLPSYISTPSATLAPTATPIPTAIPTQPISQPEPTPDTETIRPAHPSTESGVPVAGSVNQTIILTIIGSLLALLGIIGLNYHPRKIVE